MLYVTGSSFVHPDTFDLYHLLCTLEVYSLICAYFFSEHLILFETGSIKEKGLTTLKIFGLKFSEFCLSVTNFVYVLVDIFVNIVEL